MGTKTEDEIVLENDKKEIELTADDDYNTCLINKKT